MAQTAITLRPYQNAEQDAAFALWQRAWQLAYPQIDFSKRVDWFRQHWSNLLLDCKVVVAECSNTPDLTGFQNLAGFVVVSPRTGYLDQIVVAPEAQRLGVGKALIGAAKQIGHQGLYLHVNKDNARALAFYEANGFTIAGEDINRRSGAPVYMMTWRPASL